MTEMEKIRDKMSKYKDKNLPDNSNRYSLDDKGQHIKLGKIQLKILDDLMIKGFKIYKKPTRQIGAGYRNSVRRLAEKGYLIKIYNYKYDESFTAIYYIHKAKELVQEIYKEYPKLSKRPSHMRAIEVPIMRNLNKLATIQKLKHLHLQGKLNDSKRNSYGYYKMVKRKDNDWRDIEDKDVSRKE